MNDGDWGCIEYLPHCTHQAYPRKSFPPPPMVVGGYSVLNPILWRCQRHPRHSSCHHSFSAVHAAGRRYIYPSPVSYKFSQSLHTFFLPLEEKADRRTNCRNKSRVQALSDFVTTAPWARLCSIHEMWIGDPEPRYRFCI